MHQQPSRAGERRHCHLLRSHRIQLPTSAVNATLLAFAAAAPPLLLGGSRRPPLSINISCRHGAQQQTRRRGRMMGQTNRRTPASFIQPAAHIRE